MSEEKKPHHHIEINPLDEKKKKSMGNRIIVAAILIAIALPCIILGSWYWFAFVAVFLGMAAYEVLKAPQKKYKWYIWVFTYIAIYAFTFWFVIKSNVSSYLAYLEKKAMFDASTMPSIEEPSWYPSLQNHFTQPWVSWYGIAVCFGVYALFAILHEDFTWQDVTYFFTMTFIIGLGFQAILFCRYVPYAMVFNDKVLTEAQKGEILTSPMFKYWKSLIFFVFIVLTTYMNDTFAYFVGMLFGKHHMSPRISPNKTWEGFVGGVIGGAIVGFAFLMICDVNGAEALPSMKIFGTSGQWWMPLILSLTLPLVANLGDFTFSMIKRYYGFKDYSHVLGAHGGVLDRADSLLFCMIYASIFAVFTVNGWNFFR